MGWNFSGVGLGGGVALGLSGVFVLDPVSWGDSLGSLKVTVLTGVAVAMS